MWFEKFPDSIIQFHKHLVKDGNEFNIGDCNVCKYKIVNN